MAELGGSGSRPRVVAAGVLSQLCVVWRLHCRLGSCLQSGSLSWLLAGGTCLTGGGWTAQCYSPSRRDGDTAAWFCDAAPEVGHRHFCFTVVVRSEHSRGRGVSVFQAL